MSTQSYFVQHNLLLWQHNPYTGIRHAWVPQGTAKDFTTNDSLQPNVMFFFNMVGGQNA